MQRRAPLPQKKRIAERHVGCLLPDLEGDGHDSLVRRSGLVADPWFM